MTVDQRPSLSTHVLDTERGEPAAGVPVALLRWDGGDLLLVSAYETNQDGRIPSFMDQPLPVGAALGRPGAAPGRTRDAAGIPG